MRVRLLLTLLWATTCVVSTHAAARSVEAQRNIFVINDDGTRIQITSAGTDSQPDLALDGTKVVFVRKINQAEDELYLADVREPHTPLPLLKSPITIDGRRFNEIFAPKFSPDGASIYFLIRFTEAANAIAKVLLNRPAPRILWQSALGFEVVKRGRYRGDVIANVRKAKLGYGYYDCFWLLSPEGKEIGVVAPDQRHVDFFLELQE